MGSGAFAASSELSPALAVVVLRVLQHAQQADRRAPQHRSSSVLVQLGRHLLFRLQHEKQLWPGSVPLPRSVRNQGVCKPWHCLYLPPPLAGWEAAPLCTPAVSASKSQHQPGKRKLAEFMIAG